MPPVSSTPRGVQTTTDALEPRRSLRCEGARVSGPAWPSLWAVNLASRDSQPVTVTSQVPQTSATAVQVVRLVTGAATTALKAPSTAMPVARQVV